MTSLRMLLARVAAWLRVRHRDADLDVEIRTHLESLAAEHRARGLSPEAARLAAQRDFGDVTLTIELYREQRGWPIVAAVAQDAREGLRSLRRQPLFTAGAVLILAVALGVNSAIFGLVNAVLLRPLPVARPSELAYVIPSGRFTGASFDDYRTFMKAQDLFTGALATTADISTIHDSSTIRDVRGEEVSTNYFDVLEVVPSMGRTFRRDEDVTSRGEALVVISNRLWQTQFHGAADVLGKTLNLSVGWRAEGYYGPSRAYTVIGVMSEGFRGMSAPWDPTDYWVPTITRASDLWVGIPDGTKGKPADLVGDLSVVVVGRLRAGVPFEQARREIEGLGRRLQHEEHPRSPAWGLTLADSRKTALPFDPQGTIVPSRFAVVLIAVAALLLAVAIANMVGLLMARGSARRQEMAVRLTLGAGRSRIVRSVLLESLFLTLAAGAVGVIFSRWLMGMVVSSTPAQYVAFDLHRVALDVPLDWRVLAFSLAACVLTGFATGAGPARQAARTNLSTILGDGATSTARHTRRRLRHWIVVPQVAGSLVLLLVAGALLRGLWRTESVPPGFAPDGVVVMSFERPVPRGGIRLTAEDRAAWNLSLRDANRRLLERLTRVPEASAVSLVGSVSVQGLPLSSGRAWVTSRDGFDNNTHVWVYRTDVSPGYFDALRIPVRDGRTFDRRDKFGAPKVVVIDEILARRLWPGASAIGHYVAFHEPNSTYAPDWLEVIGVVGSVKLPLSNGPEAAVYTPIDQSPSQYASAIVARGQMAPRMLVPELTSAISAADTTAMVSSSQTLEDGIDAQLFTRRFALALVGGAGLLGLLLAAVGLYGVVSYSVVVRLRELGIRAALGAARVDIARLVVREGATVVALGCALGLPLAVIAVRLTSGLVVAIPPLDAATCVAAAGLIAFVVLSSCGLPALRAARTDPMKVLRQL